MRQLMIFAVVLVVLGGVAARYADQAVSSPPQQAAVVQPAYEPREPTTSGRSLMLEADRLGHFQAEARIDGRSVGFIVDTGASLVVLRESDAARVGIRPRPSDYTTTAITANGKIKAARVLLVAAQTLRICQWTRSPRAVGHRFQQCVIPMQRFAALRR